MRFKSISLTNYRCYKDVNVEFADYEKNRTITLFLGDNGSGKSEFLYAFSWILYGADFLQFKGKERMPLSLHENCINNLLLHKSNEERCEGVLVFESETKLYRVTKREVFRLNKKGEIEIQGVQQYLHYFSINKSWVSIAEGVEQVSSQLNEIIPKNLLSGIIFDGEEMKEIASPSLNSVGGKQNGLETIKGVISKITEVRVLRLIENIFNEGKKSTDSTISKKYKGVNSYEINNKTFEIDNKNKDIERIKNELERNSDTLNFTNQRYSLIKSKANEAVVIQDKMKERYSLQNTICLLENQCEERFKNFQESLKKGYLLMAKKLTDDIEAMLDESDVPEALTETAARSILKQSRCICGREMDASAKEIINALIVKLPPTNLNSQLKEEARSVKQIIKETEKTLRDDYNSFRRQDESIRKEKDKLANIEQELLGYSDEDISKVISESIRLENDINRINGHIKALNDNLFQLEKDVEKLEKEKKELLSQVDEIKVLQRKLDLFKKYLNLIKRFKEMQHQDALDQININVDKAYSLISEDYNKGRRLLLIKYTNESKYQLVPYLLETVNNLIEYDKKIGKYSKDFETYKEIYQDAEAAKRRLLEDYVLKSVNPSSNGQMAVIALAFIKAIMDYVTNVSNGILTKSVSYPLVIDLPFSDMGNENLEKASRALSGFAEQIIFLTSDSSYSLVQDNVDEHVVESFRIRKKNDEGTYSTISREDR